MPTITAIIYPTKAAVNVCASPIIIMSKSAINCFATTKGVGNKNAMSYINAPTCQLPKNNASISTGGIIFFISMFVTFLQCHLLTY